jgi:hypothetical protein
MRRRDGGWRVMGWHAALSVALFGMPYWRWTGEGKGAVETFTGDDDDDDDDDVGYA